MKKLIIKTTLGLAVFCQMATTLEAKAQDMPIRRNTSKNQSQKRITVSHSRTNQGVNIELTGIPLQSRMFTKKTSSGIDVIAVLENGGSNIVIENKTYQIYGDKPYLISTSTSGSQVKFSIKGDLNGMPKIENDGIKFIIKMLPTNNRLSSRSKVTPITANPYQSPYTRAQAPPVGQIVSGIMAIPNPSTINLEGPNISLRIRNLSAVSALEYIAKKGSYDIIFVKSDPTSTSGSQNTASQGLVVPESSSMDAPGAFVGMSTPPNSPQAAGNQSGSGGQSTIDNPRLISLTLNNRSYSQAFNAVLTASGLQASVRDGVIYIGPDIMQKAVGLRVSKTFRLNQVSAQSAGQFLGNLGAQITYTNTVTTAVSTGVPSQTAVSSASTATTTQSTTSAQVLTYGSSVGPLLGLTGTTDDRLSQVTVIGSPNLVEVAGEYLRRIDLRTRQVAITVRIYDVDLTNNTDLSNQLSFSDGKVILTSDPANGVAGAVFNPNSRGAPGIAPTNPFTEQSQEIIVGTDGTTVNAPSGLYAEGADQIVYDTFKALTTSGASKLLASPTIILTEDNSAAPQGSGSNAPNEGTLFVGENVITGLEPVENTNACKQSFSQVGLDLKTILKKVDDNGFVTFKIEPKLTAPDQRVPVPGCGDQTIVTTAERSFESGNNRVRDGQTLILTGVLSDREITKITKVPVLGDIPIFGSLFRSTGTERRKRELVITVSPRILKDDNQDSYGYYSPQTTQIRRSFQY